LVSGYVIQELTGKPYADTMDELLFAHWHAADHVCPLMAITYPLPRPVEDGKAKILRPMFNVAMWPAGSMISNANDLSRFVIAF
jgi:CubicO group peptidase (beta-lactamase class C family)